MMKIKKTKLLRGANVKNDKKQPSIQTVSKRITRRNQNKEEQKKPQKVVGVLPKLPSVQQVVPSKILSQNELEEYLAQNNSQELLFDIKELQDDNIVVEDFVATQSDCEVQDMEFQQNSDEDLNLSLNCTNESPQDEAIAQVSMNADVGTEELKTCRFTFPTQTLPAMTKTRQIRNLKSLMPSAKGRRQAIVWTKFETLKNEVSGEIVSNKCKACSQEVSAQACRMEKHLVKCNREKSTALENLEATEISSSKVFLKASEVEFPIKAEVDSKMKGWIDSTNAKEKRNLDLKVARFIYGANLSFRTVSNPLFKELFNHLRPSYKLPSPEVIGSSLLEKVYNETNVFIREELLGKKVTILQDGWSSNQNAPVISHCLHDGARSYYIDAIQTKTESKTANYCFELLKAAITKANKLFGCEIIGIGTDNAETMNCLRRKCQKEFPEIHVYGCQSHIFNLLATEMTPKSLIDEVVAVQKYFRNHHFESSALKEIGGLRPVLPNATRWNSQINSLKNFQRNQTKYLEISRMAKCDLTQNSPIFLTLSDSTTYEKISATINLLEPVAVALDACQSDTATLADAVHYWKEVEKKWPIEKADSFNLRKQMGATPTAIAAYMLHPIYRGKNLTTEEIDTGHKFLELRSPFYVAAAFSLNLSDETFYSKSYLNMEMIKHLTPALWWKGLANHKSITQSLSSFAENLMLLPASTAAIERCFSTMSDILTNKRNRLNVEKAQKLCSIYRSLVLKYDLCDEGEIEVY